jgi:hypothetical protein
VAIASPDRSQRRGDAELDAATHGKDSHGKHTHAAAEARAATGGGGRAPASSDFRLVRQPRRQRALYEYVARFRARSSVAVLPHLRAASSSGFSLAMRLRGAGGGVTGPGAAGHHRGGPGSPRGGQGGGGGGGWSVLRLEPVHHVWAIGDVHADFKENMAWIQELPAHNDDALLVTGNVATSLPTLAKALRR